MNNDLANFVVEFTTKGFKEVRDDIKELGDKMDDLASKMNGMKTHGGWLNGFLGGLETRIKALGVAIGGLGIKKAFDIKNESLALQQLSTDSGIAAQNIEALGLALKFGGFGGDKNTAGNFYSNLQLFREKLMRGEISEEQAKEWGISGLRLTPNAGIAEYIQSISEALYKLEKGGQVANVRLLADSIGLDAPMTRFLKQGPAFVAKALKEAGAETWLYEPTVARRSAELNTNWEKFKNRFNKMFSDEWLAATNSLVDVLNLLEPTMAKLVNHLGGVFGDDIRTIAEIIKTMNGDQTLGQLVDKLQANQDMAESMGEVIGMALGAIIGALIGHPVLGALIGRQVGGNIAGLINKNSQQRKKMKEEPYDWDVFNAAGGMNAWRKAGFPDLDEYMKSIGAIKKLPTSTQFVAGMSMDYLKNNPNIITNIKLDPTKPVDMTQNPDGTWTTRDGRGMTILQSEVM